MALFRIEFNLKTRERIEIAQKAYRSDSDSEIVVVVDACEQAPDGFTELDPAEVQPL